MRLHTLEVHNLNSLTGPYRIDFERLFSVSTLVLIAGKTGAGKSTLLDAIYLALFGTTPRLDKSAQSKDAEVSVQHVMTRGSGKCSAMLAFSVLDEHGEREHYRARWRLHRSRGQADGNIQPARQGLERWDSAQERYVDMLEDGRFSSFSAARNHALRGMTEQDFVQSVMLPQGQFDALLKADKKERSSALRRIVPVESYQAIGRQVATKHRAAKDAWEQESKNLNLQQEDRLGPEDRRAFEHESAELAAQIQKHTQTVSTLEARIQWQTRHKSLQESLQKASSATTSADAACQKLAPQSKQLLEHDQLDQAFARYTEHQTLQKQHVQHTRDLKTAQDAVDAANKSLKPREDAVQSAQSALTACESAHQSQQNTLQQAYTAWEARTACANEVKSAQKVHEQAVQAAERAQKKLTLREQDVHAAERKHKEARKSAADFGFSAQATTSRAALEEQLLDGRTRRHTYTQACEQQRSARKNLQDIETELKDSQREAAQFQDEISSWQQDAKTLRTLVAQELDLGPDPPSISLDAPTEWTRGLHEARGQIHEVGIVLKAYKTAVDAVGPAEQRLAAMASQQEAAAAEETALGVSCAERQKTVDASAQRLEEIHKHLATQQRYLDLVVELEHTNTCPVCGTHDPPTPDQRRKALEADREQLRKTRLDAHQSHERALAALRALTPRYEEAKKQNITLQTEHKSARTTLETAKHEEENCRKNLRSRAPEYANVPATNAKILERHLQQLRARSKHCSDWIQQCERVGAQAKRLESHQLTHTSRIETQQKNKQRADAAYAQQTQNCDAATQNLTKWTQKTRRLLENADFARFKPHKSDDCDADADALGKALKDAIAALDAFKEAELTAQNCADRVKTANEECTRQKSACAQANQDRNAAKLALEITDKDRQQANERVKTLFDGQSPRDVEARWKKEWAHVRKQLDDAIKARDVAREDHANALRKHEGAKALVHSVQNALETAAQQLQAALARAEIPNVTVLVERRLDDAVAKEIRTAVQRANDARKQAQTSEALARDQLQEHEAQQKAIGPPSDTDAKELAALRETIANMYKNQGAIREKLHQDDQLRQKLERAGQTLKTLQTQYEDWSRLHQLIGIRNGDVFAEFALALSLGELIRHANTQLETIAPRYTLQQRWNNERIPLIDFEILDREFSGDTRPISNLSGGERFQVSLAMALGLSAMSRHILPVETLLIDEGFGTLDPVTLDKAIGTLQSLYPYTGARVALISHVERLREQLPVQIVVRKRGGGHSSLDIHDGLA